MEANTILNQIGSTPLLNVGLSAKGNGSMNIFAKAEYLNPGGSIKDRVALFIIQEAEKRGELKKGMTIAEATSGNTGIAVAMIGLIKGYDVTIIMPENMSEERKKMIRALNAELILTPKEKSVGGAVEKLNELRMERDDIFVPDQFENQDNCLAHYFSTGPEIWEAMEGHVDVFVSGVGSGGTLMGTGRFLKEKNPDLKIIAVEPKNSSALLGQQPGLHQIEGIGDGFIPSIVDPGIIDEVIEIDDDDAVSTAKRLASEKGFLAGISSGANISAAIKIKQMVGNNKNIVTLLPDGAERYFSTGLFRKN
ncbi:MAG: cysteine synthase A [Desulfobacteraceae bacterium]|nr:cysteine synthase A [Desulfobacteraceae bacterium]